MADGDNATGEAVDERAARRRAAEERRAEIAAERVATDFFSAERLTFFVDAVIAIAITLLALDLPVPTGDSNHDMLRSLGDHGDDYRAFAISYLVIWAHWSSHHRLFRHVERANARVSQLTMIWLLMIIVLPWATRMINGDGAFAVRFTIYSTVQCLAGLLYMLIVRTLVADDLLYTGTERRDLFRAYLRTGVISLGFLFSIPVAFFTEWAFAVWVGIPIVLRIVGVFMHRQDRSRATAATLPS
jgi:uncharacterized membrane protein